nr:3134_t:CDS:2 [Entrophospora candida]
MSNDLGKSTPLAVEFYKYLDNVKFDKLGWQNPLASQVISRESDLIQNLSANLKHAFMESVHRMKMNAPLNIREVCGTF